MFEKCEQSTQTPECVSSASLRSDLDNFLISHRKDSSTANSLDPDTDTLVRHTHTHTTLRWLALWLASFIL